MVKYSERKSPRTQRGDTMIEVLVTIIIIAIGVLGAAGLQVTTLKNLNTSHSSTVAAIVAEDLGERMSTNAEIMRANNDLGTMAVYEHDSKPPPAPDCVANPCDAQQLVHCRIEERPHPVEGEGDDAVEHL